METFVVVTEPADGPVSWGWQYNPSTNCDLKNSGYFAKDIFKPFLDWQVYILIHISLKSVPYGSVDKWSSLVQIRAYRGHYNDVIMGEIASQITSLTMVYSAVYSGEDQRKHQSSASLTFVRGIPAQMASNAENVSIWWRHHGTCDDSFHSDKMRHEDFVKYIFLRHDSLISSPVACSRSDRPNLITIFRANAAKSVILAPTVCVNLHEKVRLLAPLPT